MELCDGQKSTKKGEGFDPIKKQFRRTAQREQGQNEGNFEKKSRSGKKEGLTIGADEES